MILGKELRDRVEARIAEVWEENCTELSARTLLVKIIMDRVYQITSPNSVEDGGLPMDEAVYTYNAVIERVIAVETEYPGVAQALRCKAALHALYDVLPDDVANSCESAFERLSETIETMIQVEADKAAKARDLNVN